MIFVTNDDGIEAAGLNALAEALESIDEVYVVAPDRERSAIGMAITLHRPLRAKRITDHVYSVDGTPVDCVDLAVSALLPERPRLLVSGINHGQNVGNDLHFSGTIAAAKKGTFLGIPSIAVSLAFEQVPEPLSTIHYETAATIACRTAKQVIAHGLPDQILLNVNVPNCPLSALREIEMTRQDLGTYSANAIKRLDRRGQPYYWIGGERARIDQREDTDLSVIRKQRVSITPIQLDFTAHHLIEPLKAWLNDENMQL
ncbi:MAG: 5'/3'-nucleotidase SurE [Candidatus Poribacteria bacterium]|nr:5'/3'-nucleotidase SurE [Candidatus Poribacteria bacterium]